jgi:hypothetical protein
MISVAICGGASDLGIRLSALLHEIGGYHTTSYDLVYPADRRVHDINQIFDLTNDVSFFGSFMWQRHAICFQLATPAKDATLSETIVRTLKINMNVLEACKLFGAKTVATTLDLRSGISATVERLYTAYARDAGMTYACHWSFGRDPAIAKALLRKLNLLDATETNA